MVLYKLWKEQTVTVVQYNVLLPGMVATNFN